MHYRAKNLSDDQSDADHEQVGAEDTDRVNRAGPPGHVGRCCWRRGAVNETLKWLCGEEKVLQPRSSNGTFALFVCWKSGQKVSAGILTLFTFNSSNGEMRSMSSGSSFSLCSAYTRGCFWMDITLQGLFRLSEGVTPEAPESEICVTGVFVVGVQCLSLLHARTTLIGPLSRTSISASISAPLPAAPPIITLYPITLKCRL